MASRGRGQQRHPRVFRPSISCSPSDRHHLLRKLGIVDSATRPTVSRCPGPPPMADPSAFSRYLMRIRTGTAGTACTPFPRDCFSAPGTEGEHSEGQPVNRMVLDGLRVVGQTASWHSSAQHRPPPKIKLVAFDVDGTLLRGPDNLRLHRRRDRQNRRRCRPSSEGTDLDS